MTQHSENSSYREKLIEHLFVAELLKQSWLHHRCELDIAKPEVDSTGYDLIGESNGVIRHIQLKTAKIGSTTKNQKIHIKLAEKPSGCVVWIYFNEESMELGPFYFYGANAGSQIHNFSELKVAKHTKGNKSGFKAERANIRVIPKHHFTKIESIEEIYNQLFRTK